MLPPVRGFPPGPILKAGVSGLRLRVTLTIRGGLGLLCLHTRHILFLPLSRLFSSVLLQVINYLLLEK